jgi:cytochrome c peroxidase
MYLNRLYHAGCVLVALICALPAIADGRGVQGANQLTMSCPVHFTQTTEGMCELDPVLAGRVNVAGTMLDEGLDPRHISLGKMLFFDPILSADRTLSCAYCHHPEYGLSDGRTHAMGRGGKGVGPSRQDGIVLPVGSPTLWNGALAPRFMWDGRFATLSEQAEGPLYHPDEMATSRRKLELTLNANATYRKLFRQAFDYQTGQRITAEDTIRAITTFEATLVSLNSRVDQFSAGDKAALSYTEQAGQKLFNGKAGCVACHSGALYSSFDLLATGVPGTPLTKEGGAKAYRVPPLRCIGTSAPYMHGGQFADLSEVMAFYDRGGGHLPGVDQRLKPLDLDSEEQKSLIEFLEALCDMTANPSIPKQVPSGRPVFSNQDEKKKEE